MRSKKLFLLLLELLVLQLRLMRWEKGLFLVVVILVLLYGNVQGCIRGCGC